MAEIIELARHRPARGKSIKGKAKPAKRWKGHKWPETTPRIVAMPLADELARSPRIGPRPPGQEAILESGVLAFRREHNGEPLILLISRKRSKKWGIPKGRVQPHLSFHENAAKEAFEEAGVIGRVSSNSVGMFRAKKSAANAPTERIIEVWVYLLEVTETLADWPEKEKRATRWVTCEAAARQLHEPVLAHLCHRLAQR